MAVTLGVVTAACKLLWHVHAHWKAFTGSIGGAENGLHEHFSWGARENSTPSIAISNEVETVCYVCFQRFMVTQKGGYIQDYLRFSHHILHFSLLFHLLPQLLIQRLSHSLTWLASVPLWLQPWFSLLYTWCTYLVSTRRFPASDMLYDGNDNQKHASFQSTGQSKKLVRTRNPKLWLAQKINAY